ncbi:TRAP dicarboxylate transporter substrate-binding protein DctP subunit [Rhizobium etli bv. phaseoli str. IE4803]|uniref:TRAP dicarboxylate transporter substrate-binding protein DctP subunit n=2 Tax=Rhizobium etli TaxID=29449 RepID=A0A060HWU8_RHIET|nr:TRAP dicarboxylate transporter substrate-binding protein DctP subunit [Rhizobium sp. IE4771]AJC79436.1 TRAP dicarboxylate transporter substrate-binding protein DctP subunit [Rhizobium etli bv. phaseoli str. IE4803]
MNRLAFIALSAAVGFGFLSPVQAEDKWDSQPWIDGAPVTMKLGYNTVRQYPHARAIERFVNRVAERTGENVQIETFPSEQAGNERAMLDSLMLGNLDIAKISTGVISTVVPEFGVFDLPYVFRDQDHMMKAVNGPVGQSLATKLEETGVKVLFWMEQGTRSFYTVKKPIATPDDLKGLKIRTTNSAVMIDTMTALGATATPMGFGDLYLGLKTGAVDGAENAPDAIWYAKQHEVSKYLSLTNHFRTPVAVVMNKAKFESLSPEYQEIILQTAKETQEWSGTLYSRVSDALLEKLKTNGMTISTVDEAPFRKAVESVYTKDAGDFGTLLDEIRAIK